MDWKEIFPYKQFFSANAVKYKMKLYESLQTTFFYNKINTFFGEEMSKSAKAVKISYLHFLKEEIH